jgi:outer membrane lipoprotein-sorting protein
MQKFLKFSFAAMALMFVFGAFGVSESKAQGGIPNEILKRMEAHRQSLTSLQATVLMAKYNAQLQETDTTEGTTMYLPAKGRDALVRIDWTRPVQETLSVVNKQYVLYRPRLNQAIVGKVDQKSKNTKGTNALTFMSMSKEQLKAAYNVQYLGQESVSGNIQTWHLKLTPKAAAEYQYAEIWVDGNGMPVQAKVVETNNDTTTVLLSNIQKNVTLDASKFKVNLPKKITIVKA